VAIWADIGGLVCWILAKRRAPLMLMLPLALSGVLMITVAVYFTGGVHSHLWVLYVVPVIFTAALLESRLTAIVVGSALLAGATPLLMSWNGPYFRSVLILAAVMALCAHVETRLLRVAIEEGDRSEYRALHDHLTGLPNRTLFYRRVRAAIAAAEAVRSEVAVLIIDLDHFKEVNDTLGHFSGDLLLQDLAKRLRRVLRTSDIVSRLGGDEFAVLLTDLTSGAAAESVAQQLLLTLHEPLQLRGLGINLKASIGLALYPLDGRDVDSLMQRADIAMYRAKGEQRGYSHYARNEDPYSADRLAMIEALRRAIEADELILHYQPKVNLDTGRLVGVEALVRWPDPRRGFIPPAEFISLAEHTGLIRGLTRVVLRRALREIGQAPLQDATVAVNISVHDLLDPQFPTEIREQLRAAGIPEHRLVLEVTEGAIMADPGHARLVLSELHRTGVQVALDDFGTGYSSLTHLRQLPVNEIKIDRSFVGQMLKEESDGVIVESIIGLAHNLGLRVVAEGVETHESWKRLADLHCDSAQGLLISPGVSVTALVSWHERWMATGIATRDRTDRLTRAS
jgi:diguanylate cyclase (GGDEF)-like protein